jgi:hypothetical protein
VLQVAFDCPHEDCLAQRAAFSAQLCLIVKNNPQLFIVPMQCAVCGNGIIVKVKGTNIPQWINVGDRRFEGEIIDVWPKRPSMNVPSDLPENVTLYFLQARGAVQGRYWDAAGTMFRKSIDVSLRALNPLGKGTLYERIESLPDEAGVTSAMKKWAHTIRRLGADAAHDDDPFSEREAKLLEKFTEAFLTYAFTLPALLRSSQTQALSG